MEGDPGLNEEPPSVSATGQNAVEDAALTITGLSIGAAESDFTLVLSVADGTLYVPTDNDLSVSGEGTDSLSITGLGLGNYLFRVAA